MRGRKLILSLLIFLIGSCAFSLCAGIFFAALQGMENRSLADSLSLAFLGLLCSVPLAFTLVGLALQIRHLLQARAATRRLASALSLEGLNDDAAPRDVWYGGVHDRHRFAIRLHGEPHRYYSGGRSRTGTRFYLRIVMELRLPEVLGLRLEHRGKQVDEPDRFESVFGESSADRLSAAGRGAMLEFVQRGHDKGVGLIGLFLKPTTRRLALRDRSGPDLPELSVDLLPDAPSILIHDHPDPGLSTEALRAILSELAAVAKAIEAGA